MTRAPASASRQVHIGAATACSSETTRRPESGRSARTSAPDFIGQFDDHGELCPLLVLGEAVAVLGGGEAALRGEAELVDVDELRRLLDAPPDLVLAFEHTGLRGDEAEHHRLALGDEPQRLEAAGAGRI